MCKVMDGIGKKDMVSLAGLDNTDVAGKEAMIGTAQLAVTVINNLGADMPAEFIQKVTDMRKEMETASLGCAQTTFGGQYGKGQSCVIPLSKSLLEFQ